MEQSLMCRATMGSQACKFREHPAPQLVKLWPVLSCNGTRRRELQREKIPELSVDHNAEIEVWACRETRIAGPRDNLSLVDVLADVDQDA